MATTNFPNGISSFGIPLFGAVQGAGPVTGQVLFVDTANGVDAGTGNGPNNPYDTLTYAISQAAANSTIYLMPGSAVTVSSATALAIATAGIQIIGLGIGSARPTITLDTANTATIAVSVANVSFQNCIFVANFLSIAACFTLSTAAGFTLINCDFRETSAVLNFLNIVKSTGAANTIDGLTVIGCNWNGIGTTSVNSFILSANAIANAKILNNTVKLAKTTDTSILLTLTTGVLTNLDCGYNNVYSAQTATTAGSLINVGGTTSTGMVYRNFAQTLTTAGDILYTTTVGLGAFENYVSGAVGASGFIIPARDT